MAQPEMPQQGLGALVPGMAQGGPVAFQFGGGVGAEFGGSSEDALAADEERRQRLIRDRKLQEDRQRYEFLVNAGATQQAQQLAQQNPEAAKPAPVAAAKPAEQKPADQTQGQNAQLNKLIAFILANRQPTTPAAPAAPSLGGLASMAKDYIPEINPPMSPEQRRQLEDEEAARTKQRFPDTVSPIMAELAQAAGQQVSPEEARRRAFMKAGIAGLGYQGRDFGAGLAGMLEGYQGTKESIEAANKEAKMNQLKARLAGEQYKDALKRKDFESARKYAEEQAMYQEKTVDARNQFKRDTLGIMSAVKGLTKPDKVAGAAEAKGGMTPKILSDIREKAIERAQPELQRLDNEFDKRTDEMFWSSSKLPKAWRSGSDEKSRKAQEDYAERRKQILDKYTNEVLDVFRTANPLVITKEQAQAIASGKK